jgi:CRP/FNR family transcriptional regulator, cyclic AMP receptor protein
MAGAIKIAQGHYLFREGDESDALYVVKSGKFAVTKTKQNSEIVLAEIGAGAMVGEMAFFDGKARSANVRALKESEVITLPFKSLHAQFQNFPEWAKAIMRTVNTNLRDANARLKSLEKVNNENDMFPPHTITKLASILNLVGHRYGKPSDEGLLVPFNTLRNYTIQIFQEPTHKMDKLMSALTELKFMKIDDMGDGKKRIVIHKADLMFSFVEWYNDWLFKAEKDRITITEDELKILKSVIHFGKKVQPDAKGNTKMSLTEMQNDSMRELSFLVKVDDVNPLIEKKLIGDKMMEESGVYTAFKMDELEKMAPYWEIIYSLKKFIR